MDRIGEHKDEMWDEEDGFFYDLLRLPDGCAFHPRCPFFDGEACEKVVPPLTFFRDGSAVACHPVQRQREAEIIAAPTGMD